MRFGTLIVAFLLGNALASSAAADERVVLMLPDEDPARRDLFAQSLAVQLTARRMQVVVTDEPLGETALGRAASAQASAAEQQARAAFWVDETLHGGALLRAVDPSSETLRFAPLPTALATIEPNVFSAIAESVLDDLIGVAEIPAVRAELAVNVRIETPVPVPPAPQPSFRAVPEWAEPPVEDNPLPEPGIAFRLSPLFAGVAGGAILDLGVYISEHVRASIFGALVVVFDPGDPAGGPGGTLAYVGQGWDVLRFEIGAQGLAVFTTETIDCSADPMEPDPCGTQVNLGAALGAFGGLGWELGPFVLGFDVHFMLAFIDSNVVPAPLVTGYIEIAP
jgi:hypothetical protein